MLIRPQLSILILILWLVPNIQLNSVIALVLWLHLNGPFEYSLSDTLLWWRQCIKDDQQRLCLVNSWTRDQVAMEPKAKQPVWSSEGDSYLPCKRFRTGIWLFGLKTACKKGAIFVLESDWEEAVCLLFVWLFEPTKTRQENEQGGYSDCAWWWGI